MKLIALILAPLSLLAADLDCGAIATQSDVALALDTAVAASNETALVYRLYSGTNAILTVTNDTNLVLERLTTNGYVKVWSSGDAISNAVADAKAEIDAAKADRAWSHHTSGLGADAPTNTTWISTPTVVIAGGLEWEKTVTSRGAVWVMRSNGMVADINTSTNAFFQIEDPTSGEPLFQIVKTDRVRKGAVLNSYSGGPDENLSMTILTQFAVGNTHPYLVMNDDLTDKDGWWAEDSGETCPFGTYSWSGAPGNWTCTVTLNDYYDAMFLGVEYVQEGYTAIRNNASATLDGGVRYNGNLYYPQVSGNKLEFVRP